jgi:anti-sigma factor RsiW
VLFAHRRLHRLVGPYLDGQLSDARAHRVAVHIRRCPGCSEEATFVARLKCSLRRIASTRGST